MNNLPRLIASLIFGFIALWLVLYLVMGMVLMSCAQPRDWLNSKPCYADTCKQEWPR